MRKNYIDLAISGLLLFPTSVALENSDNLEVVITFTQALEEWMPVLFLSSLIAGLVWGALLLFKVKIPFISIVTYTFYGMTLMLLSIIYVLPLR